MRVLKGVEDRRLAQWVSEIGQEGCIHWVTATAAACMSIFKPLLPGVPIPAHGPKPTDKYDAQTLWWRHEALHRAALRGNFAEFLAQIAPQRDALEAEFRTRIIAVAAASLAEKAEAVAGCWKDALALEQCWTKRVQCLVAPQATAYNDAWLSMSKLAEMPPLE